VIIYGKNARHATAELPGLDTPGAPVTDFQAVRSQVRQSARNWFLVLLAASALLLAAAFAWDARYEGDPDGLSYDDIALQVLHGNPGALANPYWSPLYPVVNAVLIAIFRPTPDRLLPLMHAAGFVLYALATLSFLFFIRQWIRATNLQDDGNRRFFAVTFFAWCLYLWASLRLTGVVYPLPDLLTLACVLTAAGICCRIGDHEDASWRSAALGLVLGIGYLGKFSVATMTALLFGAILALSGDRRRAARHIAIAAAVFAFVAAPLVIATSRRVGRFSMGESGRLNFAWHVNASPFLWTGPGGFAAGETRVRVVSQDPLAIEFSDPGGSVMPAWYDPAYWHAGLRTHLNAREILTSFKRRLKEAFRGAEDVVPLLAGILALLSLRVRGRESRGRPERLVRLLGIWGFLICCPFLLVHLEFRYVAGGIFLMCLAAFRALERVSDWKVFLAVTRVVGLAMLTTLVDPGHRAVLHAADALHHRAGTPEHLIVADRLRALGIQPGDAIAVAGYGMDAYYAPIAGVRVLGQVCDSATYADLDWHDPQPSCRAAELLLRDPASYAPLRQSLRRDGFKAILTRDANSEIMPPGWIRLGKTRFWALLL
jgi:hypothetical protein